MPSSSKIAGIHVRRGDKVKGQVRETMAQPLSRYMDEVELFFQRKERLFGQRIDRRIFLATDDVNAYTFSNTCSLPLVHSAFQNNVMKELKREWPRYQVSTFVRREANHDPHNYHNNSHAVEDIGKKLISWTS